MWDTCHPDDPEAQFAPTAVVGECSVGAAGVDAAPVATKPLAVMQWGSATGKVVEQVLLDVVNNELPRVRRSIRKVVAARHCLQLVTDHCRELLRKKLACPKLPARLKDRDHWLNEARVLCCDSWCLTSVPGSCLAAVDSCEAAWQEAKQPGDANDQRGRKKQRTLAQMFGR